MAKAKVAHPPTARPPAAAVPPPSARGAGMRVPKIGASIGVRGRGTCSPTRPQTPGSVPRLGFGRRPGAAAPAAAPPKPPGVGGIGGARPMLPRVEVGRAEQKRAEGEIEEDEHEHRVAKLRRFDVVCSQIEERLFLGSNTVRAGGACRAAAL